MAYIECHILNSIYECNHGNLCINVYHVYISGFYSSGNIHDICICMYIYVCTSLFTVTNKSEMTFNMFNNKISV